MKRILMLYMLMLIITVPVALAVTGNAAALAGTNPNRVRATVEIRSRVTGLENAILRVKSNETSTHLEQVLARIRAHHIMILQKLDGLHVEKAADGTIEASGRKNAKFLGLFPVMKTNRYRINDDGSIIRKAGLLDPLWVEEPEVI